MGRRSAVERDVVKEYDRLARAWRVNRRRCGAREARERARARGFKKERETTDDGLRTFAFLRRVVLGDVRKGTSARAAVRRADSTRRVAIARATQRGDEQQTHAIAGGSASSTSSSSADALTKYVSERGGKRVIRKVLIANNGMAATKSILSMRRWAFNTFGDDHAIQFLAMATPEDIAANAEFIRFADDYVEVPGGSNKNNYANVPLITEIAKREGVDAVWPGWGHASENRSSRPRSRRLVCNSSARLRL